MSKQPQPNKTPASDRKPAAEEQSDLPPDADVEERFNDFMKRNGAAIFAAIVLGGAAVLGYQIYQYAGERAMASAQESFQSAVTMEEKLAFAADHRKFQLAGVAYLEVADEVFESKDYSTAADYYAEARAILEPGPFRGRAQLGEGLSLLLSGNAAGGRDLLQGVASDVNLLDQIRGEAAYHLAVSAWEVEDFAQVQAALDTIMSLENPGFWRDQALDLESRIPELASAN
ncbi:MAG: tetratricopeptide repeat protein [Opitutales bacterium]|nr:tetratricopeptide repeat protein [Opitutales bacterium]